MEGSQEAQEILYEKYKKIITDYIGSKYSLYYDIEDDVSEIMIKIIMGIESYDSKKSRFKSWAISIAKNHMIDKWRSNAGNPITLASGSSSVTLNCTTTSDSLYITSDSTNFHDTYNTFTSCCGAGIEFENCSSINHISNQLSAQDFTLLDMKYVQGYDYTEIGNEFNVSSSTISNRVNYIKSKLKKNNSEDI